MGTSLRVLAPLVAAVGCSFALAATPPDPATGPIDLSGFPGPEQSLADPAGGPPIEEAAYDWPAASRRFYIAGIVGASFATLTSGGGPGATFPNQALANSGAVNDTLFTAGGAAGIAIDRPGGLLRVEFEGRARDLLAGQTSLQTDTPTLGIVPYAVRAANGWSTMANVWRDWFLGERLGLYAGGGIGAGGYDLSANLDTQFSETLTGRSSVSSFAWQAGGGVTHRFTDRLTLDVGYRFFAIDAGSTPLTYAGFPLQLPFGDYTSAFAASELLLSVRVEEPFRNWRR